MHALGGRQQWREGLCLHSQRNLVGGQLKAVGLQKADQGDFNLHQPKFAPNARAHTLTKSCKAASLHIMLQEALLQTIQAALQTKPPHHLGFFQQVFFAGVTERLCGRSMLEDVISIKYKVMHGLQQTNMPFL